MEEQGVAPASEPRMGYLSFSPKRLALMKRFVSVSMADVYFYGDTL